MSPVQRIICTNCKSAIYTSVHEWIFIKNPNTNATARLPTCSQHCADAVYAKLAQTNLSGSSVSGPTGQPQHINDDPFE